MMGCRRTAAGIAAVLMLAGLTGCTEQTATTASATTSVSSAARAEPKPVRMWERQDFAASRSSLGADSWIAVNDTYGGRGVGFDAGPLKAYDAKSGTELWSVSVLDGKGVCAISSRYDGASVVGLLGGPGCATLGAVDVTTGALRWSRAVDSRGRTIRSGARAIALGDDGGLSHPGRPYACFASSDGTPLPATNADCIAAVGAESWLVRAEGDSGVFPDYVELARHDGVSIGWLNSESSGQLIAFDTDTGARLWKRARVQRETVFADARGFVRVSPDGDGLALTRVDPRTWAPLAQLGSVPEIEFVAHVGDVSIFLRPNETSPINWLSGYRLG